MSLTFCCRGAGWFKPERPARVAVTRGPTPQSSPCATLTRARDCLGEAQRPGQLCVSQDALGLLMKGLPGSLEAILHMHWRTGEGSLRRTCIMP